MLQDWAHRLLGVSRQPQALHWVVVVGVVLGVVLLVHSASADNSVAKTFSVPLRAPRETLLRSKTPCLHPLWARTEATKARRDRVSDAPGFSIAGISIVGTKGPATASQKGPNDRFGESGLRTRWSEGRNATSNGLALDAVSGIGWLVGAFGVGVGTYLLVTSDKNKGHETTVGADFYSKGAGLRVRRRW